MLPEIILSIVSTVIAVLALAIALITWTANKRASSNIQHYNLVTQADRMIAGNKKVLRFHGINPDTIEEEFGVTSTELTYLLQSLNSGSISNILSNDGNKKPFEEGTYWYDLLKNDATQKAFPLIKRLFDSKNHYIARCEETIRLLNNMDAKNTDDQGRRKDSGVTGGY